MTAMALRGPLGRCLRRHGASVTLRAAMRRDVAAVAQLQQAATRAEHRLLPDIAPRRLDTRTVRRSLRRSIAHPRSRIFVAARCVAVVGMIGAELVTARQRHAAVRRHVYLHSLFVVPRARRLGLARRLTQLALDWGRGRGAVQARLEMAAPNSAARRLYESIGFQPREMMFARPLSSLR